MGKYIINVSEEAKKHLSRHRKTGNKANIRKLERIFKELSETPYKGVGEPELLKYNYSGYWSRRINRKDRVIYSVEEGIVTGDK